MAEVINAVTRWPIERELFYDDGTSEIIAIDPNEVAATEAANAELTEQVTLVDEVSQELKQLREILAKGPYSSVEQAIIDQQIKNAMQKYLGVKNPSPELSALVGAVR